MGCPHNQVPKNRRFGSLPTCSYAREKARATTFSPAARKVSGRYFGVSIVTLAWKMRELELAPEPVKNGVFQLQQ